MMDLDNPSRSQLCNTKETIAPSARTTTNNNNKMFKRELVDASLLSSPTIPEDCPRTTTTTNYVGIYYSSANCICGKVQTKIHTMHSSQAPPPIRLVCYCRDCRGYFETLQRLKKQKKSEGRIASTNESDDKEEVDEMHMDMEEEAKPANGNMLHHRDALETDEWGGVDWTCLYPRDVQILQGQEFLKVVKIRPDSKIHQVYSTCCHSPMFRIGAVSLLFNSNIISTKSIPLAPLHYRIIGRQAWNDPKVNGKAISKPKMSWSVPWKWYFAMPQRIRNDLMEPLPFEYDENKVQVLEGFQEGSM